MMFFILFCKIALELHYDVIYCISGYVSYCPVLLENCSECNIYIVKRQSPYGLSGNQYGALGGNSSCSNSVFAILEFLLINHLRCMVQCPQNESSWCIEFWFGLLFRAEQQRSQNEWINIVFFFFCFNNQTCHRIMAVDDLFFTFHTCSIKHSWMASAV